MVSEGRRRIANMNMNHEDDTTDATEDRDT